MYLKQVVYVKLYLQESKTIIHVNMFYQNNNHCFLIITVSKIYIAMMKNKFTINFSSKVKLDKNYLLILIDSVNYVIFNFKRNKNVLINFM